MAVVGRMAEEVEETDEDELAEGEVAAEGDSEDAEAEE